MTTLGKALDEARGRLSGASASPALDAEVLLAHVLAMDRGRLRARDAQPCPPAALARFRELVARRALGEPVAYLTGSKGFRDLELEVGPGVLIPRPETELLVELALRLCAGLDAPAVLDVGTGSGAIALALARECPGATVVAVDVSPEALVVARRNAKRAGIANVAFVRGRWLDAIAGRFDVIVSNPPYVAAGDPHLSALAHEPVIALVPGPSGLEAIEALLARAPGQLARGGWLLVEHGSAQGGAVRRMFRQARLEEVGTFRDLAGLERVTAGRRPAPG